MTALDPLSELAIKYKSDKWSAKHSYTAWYYEQFKDRRETVRKVVEIGVGEGASLRMWREFFPNAIIYGADNDPARVFVDDRIVVMPCDQSDWKDLDNLLTVTGIDIDLFIDDGSHLPADQIYTCLHLMAQLCPEVVYVIEDVQDPKYIRDHGGYSYEVPKLEHRNRYDNRLVVVEHAIG